MQERIQELRLPLNVKTKEEILIEGLSRYCAKDREHPSARFYMQDDIKQQRAYEATRTELQTRMPSEQAMQLVLDLSLEPVVFA